MLLTAKLAVALVQMLAIIIIAAGMLLLGVTINPQPEQIAGIDFATLLLFIMEAGTYAAVFTVAASIYIGAWGTMIAVAFAIAGNYLGRFRWLAGIAVFIAASAGFNWLQETWLYKHITDWGAINIQIHNFPWCLRRI
jgi:hypothetical protein